MSIYPERLQGTDGVRGEVVGDDDSRLEDMSPLAAFMRKGLITPAFVELYCYSFVEFLRRSLLFNDGNKIALGYDPRDPGRVLVERAIDGLTKAGATVLDTGVIPTPGLGIYTIASGASGGVMITASHNPADQNGIKLFLPDTALKLFPEDDKRFTAIVYELDGIDLPGLESMGRTEDVSAEARETFESFFADSLNSWIKGADFSDTILVVDCANGALAPFAKTVTAGFGFRLVEEAGILQDGASINRNCGAGLLEGHSIIDADYRSDRGADFRTVDFVQALFHHGRNNSEAIKQGPLRVAGAAFDGDGDRFYHLEYDPFEDRLLILSGDEIAYHLADYLRKRLGDEYNGVTLMAVTVESDINVTVAGEELDFIPVVTGVGDKWLLLEAFASLLGATWDTLEQRCDNMDLLAELEQTRGKFESMASPAAVSLLALLREAEKLAESENINVSDEILMPEAISFSIGGEETGHTVTLSRVKLPGGKERLTYIGNGLKSALNLHAATRKLAAETDRRLFYQRLYNPFPKGFKKTYPVYYTDKCRLTAGSLEWKALEDELVSMAEKHFGGDMAAFLKPLEEEPDMIYLALADPVPADERSGTVRAAVFIRNSGTEAKTSVYLRGDATMQIKLNEIGERIAARLSALMKDRANPYAAAELEILRRLQKQGPLPFDMLADLVRGVNAERLMVEMSLKQGLIKPLGNKLALTEHGGRVLEAMRDENV